MTYSNETLFNTHKAKIYHEILRDFAKHQQEPRNINKIKLSQQ